MIFGRLALELLAPTDTCRQALDGCAGGKYGPVSPNGDAMPPSYLTIAIHRNNGPEDRSVGERCMARALPEFGTASGGSYRRIVQGPDEETQDPLREGRTARHTRRDDVSADSNVTAASTTSFNPWPPAWFQRLPGA